MALLVDSPTNQQFVVVPDEIYAQLAQKYSTDYNGKPDPDHTAIRFCTGCPPPRRIWTP